MASYPTSCCSWVIWVLVGTVIVIVCGMGAHVLYLTAVRYVAKVLQCTSTQQTIRMHHAFPEVSRIALAQTKFKQIFINLAVNAVKYSTDMISIVVTITDRHFMLGVFSQSNMQKVQERTRYSQRYR